MKIRQNKYNLIGIIASANLIFLALIIFCPITSNTASAADTVSTTSGPSSISVALQPNIEMDVTPTSEGTFQTTTSTLTVSTDSTGGYTLYMRTANNQNTLTGVNNNARISAISKNTTKPNFPNNSWGYKLGTNSTITDYTLFQPVPTSNDTPILSTESTKNSHKLTFAAKVTTDIPTDQYRNSVLVSAVANPAKVTTLSSITYMQDMQPEICANSTEDETKRLTDSRDGKKYYVAKMKNGSCWMTQNLALDITTAGLKASDTDIEEDWNSSSTYPPAQTSISGSAPNWGSDKEENTYSWNPGNWTLGTPTQSESCGFYTRQLSDCEKYGLVKIDSNWKPTFISKNGIYNGPGNYQNTNTYVSLDYSAKTYDPHYLIGNYYQYNTATAGTASIFIENGQTEGDAPGSICPKGWKLSNGITSKANNPFGEMLAAYGLVEINSYGNGNNWVLNNTVNGVKYDVATKPLYFVRSGGNGTASSNYISDVASEGAYWLSTVDRTGATRYKFEQSSIGIYYIYSRHMPLSVRCVAR